ncbi:hypothetical protein FJTKL_14890 [Diaporthe vaccinii]|uniref:Uncharacterized protein n=1 Tax=Diaporthe vaccinii TaxID=105482 RepID=A0ABR4F8H0_9PEZI
MTQLKSSEQLYCHLPDFNTCSRRPTPCQIALHRSKHENIRFGQHQDRPCLSSSISQNAKLANVGIRSLIIVFISSALPPPPQIFFLLLFFCPFPFIKRIFSLEAFVPLHQRALHHQCAHSSTQGLVVCSLSFFPKNSALPLAARPSTLSSIALSFEACLACAASSPLKTLPAPWKYQLATATIRTGAQYSMSSLVT